MVAHIKFLNKNPAVLHQGFGGSLSCQVPDNLPSRPGGLWDATVSPGRRQRFIVFYYSTQVEGKGLLYSIMVHDMI